MNAEHTSKEIPLEYIKKRKKSMIIFCSSIYLYCMFFVAINLEILKFNDGRTYMASIGAIGIFSVISLMRLHIAKRIYKGYDVPNYNEIKVFSVKEGLLLVLPILVSSYFIVFQLAYYLCLLGTAHLTINGFYRPVHFYEFRR